MSNHREIIRHSFHGGRFSDHGADVSILDELHCYQRLVADVAKHLWRQRHQDKKHVPAEVDAKLNLKVYSIECNCVTFPLSRPMDSRQLVGVDDDPEELQEAVELITETISAVASDAPIPDRFPKSLLGKFESYGHLLKSGEWIEFRLPERSEVVRYDESIRERLIASAGSDYEDSVDVVGTVTMLDVEKLRFHIRLSQDEKVPVDFVDNDSDLVSRALNNRESTKLRVKGRGRFSSVGKLRHITAEESPELVEAAQVFDRSSKPIWEVFEEVARQLPKEVVATLPVDGARRVDFYLYGSSDEGDPP